MAFLPRPVTRMMLSMPAATASSTPYWMIGLSTSGSISLGCALVAGRKRVPRAAAGKTALRTIDIPAIVTEQSAAARMYNLDEDCSMIDPTFVRDHIEEVRTGLRHRGL